MTAPWRALLVFCAALAGLAGGCAPAIVATAGVSAVQVGSSAFVRGETEATERVPLAAAYAAAHRALEHLDLRIEKETLYPHLGFITAQEAGGRRIRITLERKSSVVTKFNIRVGVWGDQTVSKLILFQIQEELEPQWGRPANPGRSIPFLDE